MSNVCMPNVVMVMAIDVEKVVAYVEDVNLVPYGLIPRVWLENQ